METRSNDLPSTEVKRLLQTGLPPLVSKKDRQKWQANYVKKRQILLGSHYWCPSLVQVDRLTGVRAVVYVA